MAWHYIYQEEFMTMESLNKKISLELIIIFLKLMNQDNKNQHFIYIFYHIMMNKKLSI